MGSTGERQAPACDGPSGTEPQVLVGRMAEHSCPESVPSSEGPAAFLSPAPVSRRELSLTSPVGSAEAKNRQEKAFVSSAEPLGAVHRDGVGLDGEGAEEMAGCGVSDPVPPTHRCAAVASPTTQTGTRCWVRTQSPTAVAWRTPRAVDATAPPRCGGR